MSDPPAPPTPPGSPQDGPPAHVPPPPSPWGQPPADAAPPPRSSAPPPAPWGQPAEAAPPAPGSAPSPWGQPSGGAPAPGSPRRGPGTKVFVLAAVVAVLLVGGTTTAVLVAGRHDAAPRPSPAAVHTPTPTATPIPPTPLPTADTSAGGSVAFTDPDGNFSASFSGAPVKDTSSTPVNGQQLTYVQFTNLVNIDVVEVVAYADYPPSIPVDTPNVILSAGIQSAATHVNGTILSKTFATVQGFPSVDALVSVPASGSSPNGYLGARLILAGHTVFEVLSTGLDNPPAGFAPLSASLTILKHSP